jgi:hypothetical protein
VEDNLLFLFLFSVVFPVKEGCSAVPFPPFITVTSLCEDSVGGLCVWKKKEREKWFVVNVG